MRLTDAPDDLVEEAVFGDDPERRADAIGIAILLALAAAHARHPEYDAYWRSAGNVA